MKTKNVKTVFKEPNITEKTIRLRYKEHVPYNPDNGDGSVTNIYMFKTDRAKDNFIKHAINNNVKKLKAMIKRGSAIKLN